MPVPYRAVLRCWLQELPCEAVETQLSIFNEDSACDYLQKNSPKDSIPQPTGNVYTYPHNVNNLNKVYIQVYRCVYIYIYDYLSLTAY